MIDGREFATPCALGLGIPPPHGETDAAYTARVLDALRPAWWHDWRYRQMGVAGYVPSVWRMDAESIAAALEVAAANAQIPLWLLGNEPELEAQSDTPAHIAAAACRQWVRKTGTWAIPWACPGINITPHMWAGAQSWLDGYLAEKGPVPHMWHVHLYGGPGAWRTGLATFRAWMQARRVVRPIIVSECGDSYEPRETMQAIRASLANGEIQAAAWFSAYYELWNDTGLMDADGELTDTGRIWLEPVYTVHVPAYMR